jgi:hypothetical protein
MLQQQQEICPIGCGSGEQPRDKLAEVTRDYDGRVSRVTGQGLVKADEDITK